MEIKNINFLAIVNQIQQLESAITRAIIQKNELIHDTKQAMQQIREDDNRLDKIV